MASLSVDAGRLNPKSFVSLDRSVKYMLRDYYAAGVYVNTQNLGSRSVSTVDHAFVGKIIDGFHARKNAGELIPNTYYLKVDSEIKTAYGRKYHYYYDGLGVLQEYYSKDEDGNADKFLFYPQFGDAFDYNVVGLAENHIISSGIDERYLVQAAASKLYSRGWDALTFLAEFRLTVRMFREVFANLLKMVDGLITFLKSKYGVNAHLHLFSEVANNWLQGRYGWRILMYDIEDIGNLIKSLNEKQLQRSKDRVGKSIVFQIDRSTVTNLFSSVDTYSDITTVTINARGSVIADFAPSRVILNPITSAWELTTLSFVIDWFINVGSALNSLSFLAVTDKYTACMGVSVTAERIGQLSVVWHNGVLGVSEQEVHQSWSVFRRQPCTVPTVPMRTLNLDGFKVLDLLALLFQRISRFT